ncbi:MAG: hypothetical protein GXP55_02565 [Deltaproteobacteria bacterium]|nr:hypothetical protein [Deltaproteobacteria bacterium]
MTDIDDEEAREPSGDGSAEEESPSSKDTEARDQTGSDDEAAGPPDKTARITKIQGALLAFVGLTFALMSNEGRVPRGPLWGFFTLLVGVIGLLHAFGLFSRSTAGLPRLLDTSLGRLEHEPRWRSLPYGLAASAAIVMLGALIGGYDHLPITFSLALLVLVPAALSRPALLVFVVVSAIYLPLLSTYGLWDPWETHYGEVAREILSRDDWISTWWAQENWFWSKPIYIFWSEALSMGALGINFHPDAHPLHPELALRLPHYLLAMLTLISVQITVSRIFTKRSGVLAALVLASSPLFFFLAHQAITDMPLVGNLTIAMCMLILALREDPEREIQSYRLGRFSVSAREAVMALFSMLALPQALYLISRNITRFGVLFSWHGDSFLYGSAGNDGVPGNAALHAMQPAFDGLLAQPAAQGLIWLVGFSVILYTLKKERRTQGLYMAVFYIACGLAFMGKGIPGFALPGLIALFYLIVSGRWKLLTEGRLRVMKGALTVGVVGLPWYVAMYIRHGNGFTDQLLVQDHFQRLLVGVHGDKGTIQYYIEQFGYAAFPWAGLVLAAILGWAWYRDVEGDGAPARQKRMLLVMVSVWFFTTFTLFSAMITKFHYYIFPAVPPAAIAVGIFLDRLWARPDEGDGARRIVGTLVAMGAPLLLVVGIAGSYGDVRGVIPEGVTGAAIHQWVFEHPWPFVRARALILGGALMMTLAAWLLRREADGAAWRPQGSRQKAWLVCTGVGLLAIFLHGALAAVVVALALTMLLSLVGRIELPTEGRAMRASVGVAVLIAVAVDAFIGRDLAWATAARPQGYERLIHLFVYNYGRVWPEQFDYRPILTGFVVVSVGLIGISAFRGVRPVASRALLGAALLFTAWCVNVYMVDLSPHWGQRELVFKYYDERTGPEQPLVAWQMNWKGENFYTGNHVSAFVDLDNAKLRTWVGAHAGTTAYFLLEHSRLGSLRGVLSGHRIDTVTDKRFCNKFILVKVTL